MTRLLQMITLLLAVILAMALLNTRVATYRHKEKMEALLEQAAPYRREIKGLEQELILRKAELSAQSPGIVVIGFQVVSEKDLDYIAELEQRFGFSSAIVLDCNYPEKLEQAIRASGRELVLTSVPFDAALISKRKAEWQANAFLLRRDEESPENLETLKKEQFDTYIRYAGLVETPGINGQIFDLGYSFIKNDDFSIEERLFDLIEEGSAVMFVFDINSMEEGELTRASVLSSLDMIEAQKNEGNLDFYSLSESKQEFIDREDRAARLQSQYDEFTVAQQEKIAELQKKVDEIYSAWDKESEE